MTDNYKKSAINSPKLTGVASYLRFLRSISIVNVAKAIINDNASKTDTV
ncbi:hypothetical protein HC026_09465 [Lactobacillus sp. LC28-10]|uniref:Uncharacterized protein n=1 Tax=Secundilactobacillus angelensis TaxID=2722706 RepID=A0ABX1KYX7_9LACO|nr:hypothetical protein [Secundilactobacillus angelensis]